MIPTTDGFVQLCWATILNVHHMKEYAPHVAEDEFPQDWIYEVHGFQNIPESDAASKIGPAEEKDQRPSEILIMAKKSTVSDKWASSPEVLFPSSKKEEVEAHQNRTVVGSYLAACGMGNPLIAPSEHHEFLTFVRETLNQSRPSEIIDGLKISTLAGDPPDLHFDEVDGFPLVEFHEQG